MKGREHEREKAKGRRWKLKGKKRKEGSELNKTKPQRKDAVLFSLSTTSIVSS